MDKRRGNLCLVLRLLFAASPLLSHIEAQDGTLAQVLEKANRLMLNTSTTTASDIISIVDVVEKSVMQAETISIKDAQAVLDIVHFIVCQDDEMLQEARMHGNATNRFIMLVDYVADKVDLTSQASSTAINNTCVDIANTSTYQSTRTSSVRLVTPSAALEVWELSTNSVENTSDDRSAFETSDLAIGFERLVTDDRQLEKGRVMKPDELVTMFEKDVPSDGVVDGMDLNKTDVALFLPAEFLKNLAKSNTKRSIRVSFSVFTDTSLFGRGRLESRMPGKSNNRSLLNSNVISARITVDNTSVTDLEGFNVTVVFSPFKSLGSDPEHVEHTRCVFWDFAGHDGYAAWSDQGCTRQDNCYRRDICSFNHLTNFAVLVDLYGQSELPEEHQHALSTISIVGLSMSIAGLALTIFSILRDKKLRQNTRQQVLLNLATAMLLAWVVFLAGFSKGAHWLSDGHVTCIVVAALLHYLILSSFLWMLMEGVLQYLYFVQVFHNQNAGSHLLLKMISVAWGLPLIPVVVIVAVGPQLYNGGDRYCWMSQTPFFYAFLLPMALVMLSNIVIYITVVVNLCTRFGAVVPPGQKKTSRQRTLEIRTSFACFVVLGLSWVSAFLAVEDARVVFQYIFTITTTLQGFVIFVVFTLKKPDSVRELLGRFRTSTRSAASSASSSSTSTSGSSVESTWTSTSSEKCPKVN